MRQRNEWGEKGKFGFPQCKWDVTGPELDEETGLVTSHLVDDFEEVIGG